ncbi:MAG: aspartate/glutamate racemase family protein [Nitrososphaerales archaeon]
MTENRRIGMIYPAAGRSEKEFEKLAPENVDVHVTRINFSKEELSQLLEMEEHLDDAVDLLSQAGVDLILFNCTTGSLVKGKGYDRHLIDKMEGRSGIPAMTTATAAISALREIGSKKISLITAYPQNITEMEARYLEDNGIGVIKSSGAGVTDPFEQARRDPSFWFDFSIENFDKRSDGLFLSCAGIRVIDVVSKLEDTLSVPVITSNQAAMWACLRKLQISEPKKGYGTLLAERLLAPSSL